MDLPPEIITDILHYLPAKSLGRFKTVSTTWLALISQPKFIKRHQNTRNRYHLICTSNNGSLYTLPLNEHDTEKPKNLSLILPHAVVFIFHGSCNGLVLGSVDDFVGTNSLVVLNPTTNVFIVPQEPGYEMLKNLMEVDIMYGFGYDSVTDDYKVVTVSYFHFNYLIPPDNMSVHVYSCKNNSWRWVMDSSYDHSHGKSLPGVLVNGFLHWIVNKRSDDSRVIVAFSLADETFSEVPSPDLGNDVVDIMSRRDCKLVTFGEKLGLWFKDEVWLMNEYGVGESWSKIVIDGLNENPIVEPKMFYEDGKILMVSGDRMWIYDVKDESFCKSIDISRNIKGLKVKVLIFLGILKG